eukprot:m.60075 g.60075  ORF g.60075 m.60075 type:complete len:553 (+) comp34912_c0_seq2:84-1742(+)
MSATRFFRSPICLKLIFDEDEEKSIESQSDNSTIRPFQVPDVKMETGEESEMDCSFVYNPLSSPGMGCKGDEDDEEREKSLTTKLESEWPFSSSSSPLTSGSSSIGSPYLSPAATPCKILRRTKLRTGGKGVVVQRRSRRLAFTNGSTSAPSGLKEFKKKPIGAANVNPFTPLVQNSHKRKLMSTEDTEDPEIWDDGRSPLRLEKRLRLRDNNISRYAAEFQEICEIGSGEFAQVYKCRNRLDGCVYALKRSTNPVADELAAFREVCAHAVLGSHSHIVRYYSAWAECDRMIIQNEFCNGGSLASAIADRKSHQKTFAEIEMKQLLFQIAQGLKHIHSMNLVHLDVKPGNIFISCTNPKEAITSETLYSGDSCCREIAELDKDVLYKIGDMGHVTSVIAPEVEEGDCRYMANEILQEDYHHLPKADIFALALTVFATCDGENLPKNGPEWHRIRAGWIPEKPSSCLPNLGSLLKTMIDPEAACRPSAEELTQHPALSPYSVKSKDVLRRKLNEERLKNEILRKQLEEAQGSKRLIGKCPKGRVNRSMSVNQW